MCVYGCEDCLCNNCVNHSKKCCDCDICEDGDMTVWGCNQYVESKTVFIGYDEYGRPCFETREVVPETN